MHIALGLLACAVFLTGAFGVGFHHYVVRLSKARACLARGAILVDVDSAGDFARHHPRVAVNIPLEELAQRAHELGSREQSLVVFARCWRRGSRAAYLLEGMGYWEVINAAGLRTRENLHVAASSAAEARDAERMPEFAPDPR